MSFERKAVLLNAKNLDFSFKTNEKENGQRNKKINNKQKNLKYQLEKKKKKNVRICVESSGGFDDSGTFVFHIIVVAFTLLIFFN